MTNVSTLSRFSLVEENGGRPYKSLDLINRWFVYCQFGDCMLPTSTTSCQQQENHEESIEIWSAKHPNSQARVLLTASWIDHGAFVEITAWSFLSLSAKTTPTSDRKQKENTMSLVQFSGNLQHDETICDKMPQEITKHIKACFWKLFNIFVSESIRLTGRDMVAKSSASNSRSSGGKPLVLSSSVVKSGKSPVEKLEYLALSSCEGRSFMEPEKAEWSSATSVSFPSSLIGFARSSVNGISSTRFDIAGEAKTRKFAATVDHYRKMGLQEHKCK